MVKIKKQLVSQDVVNKRSYGKGNPVDYVIIHQTGNKSKGANAEMHARLQSRLNPRQASWHEQVDDKQAIQSFDDTHQCWAAGDGKGPGNTKGYHIEICINSDGDYKQAVKNGAKRARIKLKEHGLGIDRLKQHADFANKSCPAQIRAGVEGITWNDFVNMVKDDPVGPKPSKPTSDNFYRVRKSWKDAKSQIGAYTVLDNAKKQANDNKGYNVYDNNGKRVDGSKPTPSAYKTKYPLANRVLLYGATGEDVKKLQRALNAIYFKVGAVDGSYGPSVKDAVERFQSVYLPYEVDGKFGPNTRKKLQAVLKSKGL